MNLLRRIERLEGRSPAEDPSGALELLKTYVQAIAQRLALETETPKLTLGEVKADFRTQKHKATS